MIGVPLSCLWSLVLQNHNCQDRKRLLWPCSCLSKELLAIIILPLFKAKQNVSLINLFSNYKLQRDALGSSLLSSSENTAQDHGIFLLRKFWIIFVLFSITFLFIIFRNAQIFWWRLLFHANKMLKVPMLELLLWKEKRKLFVYLFYTDYSNMALWLHGDSHPHIFGFNMRCYHLIGMKRECSYAHSEVNVFITYSLSLSSMPLNPSILGLYQWSLSRWLLHLFISSLGLSPMLQLCHENGLLNLHSFIQLTFVDHILYAKHCASLLEKIKNKKCPVWQNAHGLHRGNGY